MLSPEIAPQPEMQPNGLPQLNGGSPTQHNHVGQLQLNEGPHQLYGGPSQSHGGSSQPNGGPPQQNGGPPQLNGGPPQLNGGPSQPNVEPSQISEGPPQPSVGPSQHSEGPPQPTNGGQSQPNVGHTGIALQNSILKCPSLLDLHPYISSVMISSSFTDIEKREHPTLLNTLEQIKETEPNIYDMNQVYLDIYLYLWLETKKNIVKARRELEKHITDDNLILLQLLIKCGDRALTEKRKGWEIKLQQNCNEQNCAVASAEIAFYLSSLDYRFYKTAAEMLEASLPNIPDEHKIFWQYQLGKIYSKMLNKDFWMGVNSQPCIFKHCQKHLIPVIESGHQLRGRAMVDLADTHKKCRRGAVTLDQGHDDANTLMRQAWELIENESNPDPHMLERYGRYLRLENSLEKSAETLKQCTDICPSRHCAWHQRAVALRHLWLEQNGLNLKQKSKLSKKKGRLPYSSVAENLGTKVCSDSGDYQLKSLRSYNPQKTDKTVNNELLEEAKMCMIEANKCLDDKCSVYLIEQARIHMSLGETMDADECLESACQNECDTRTSELDKAVLYEQLGIFHLQAELRSREEVKEFLRLAIEKTAFTKKKPLDAFSVLNAILQEDLEQASDEDSISRINLECAHVHKCMEQSDKAKQHLQLVTQSAQKTEVLVRLLQAESKYSEAYFSLYTSCAAGWTKVTENTAKHLLELASKAVQQRTSCDVKSIYMDVFKLLKSNGLPHHGQNASSEMILEEIPLHYNFVVIVDNGDDDLVEKLHSTLEHFTFSVYVASVKGYSDIELGENILAAPVKVIAEHADVVLCYLPTQTELPTYLVDNTIALSMRDKLIRIRNDSTCPKHWEAVSSVEIPVNCGAENVQCSDDHRIISIILQEIINKWFGTESLDSPYQ